MNHVEAAAEAVTLDPLLTEKQLCAWLGIGLASALRWRVAGDGPRFVVLGPRRIAYRKSSVEQWLADRERGKGSLAASGRWGEATEDSTK